MVLFTRYRKAVAALLAAVGTWGGTALANDGVIDGVEWFGLLGVLASALLVAGVPNDPPVGAAPDPGVSERG